MANKFVEKKTEIEVIGEIYSSLEEKVADASRDWRKIGDSDVQDTHWKTGELLWEDEEKTIPKMKENWGYVDIPECELSEEKLMRIAACKKIMAALEKMI